MSLSDLINIARWDAYRDRMHCAQRRKAFERDAAKAVKGFEWQVKPYSSCFVLKMSAAGPRYYATGLDKPFDREQLAEAVSAITLEALRDVARETKNRLDSKPARP